MALMLCRFEDCRNTGEQDFYNYCVANLGDEIVVLHNRYLDGLEFDFCLLIPQYGVLIVEVKGWNKETYQGYQKGKLWIKTEKGKIEDEDPYFQVRLYKTRMENLFLNKLGWYPLIERCVCFTEWEDDFLYRDDIVAYMGHSKRQLIGKEDLSNKNRFYQKIQNVFLPSQKETNFFSDDQLIKTRDFFEPGYARDALLINREKNPITLEGILEIKAESEKKKKYVQEIPPYSIISIVPAGAFDQVDHLLEYYSKGAKIIAVFCDDDLQKHAAEGLTNIYQRYSIVPDGSEKLKMSREKAEIKADKHIRFFNWNSHVIDREHELASMKLFVVDGQMHGDDLEILEKLDDNGMMNLAQYQVEHGNEKKHVLVRAGAGTGKTTVMIDRIAYLVYRHQMSSAELRDRIVMITFTDAAADNMSRKLKERFQYLYLLTGHGEYLSMVGQINQMQISTIHSFALKIIQKLCVYSGYSNDLAVESGQYNRKKYLQETLEQIVEEKMKTDTKFFNGMGLRVYEIREKLLQFVEALENKSIDLTQLDPVSFGVSNDNPKLHQLFMEVIPRAERSYEKELKERGKIFLGRLMPELVKAIEYGQTNGRLQEGLIKRDRYLFVDEFQDTDDYQIKVILKIVEAMEYHLFCVGDEKQCIYRFRGAEEQAFDRLNIHDHKEDWDEFSLVHNYRSDNELLKAFEPYFVRWNNNKILKFDLRFDKLDNPIKYNNGLLSEDEYMHRICVKNSDDVLPALFNEIKNRIKIIEDNPDQHKSDEDRIIAILVRENWQARDVRDYSLRHPEAGIKIETETGGDLFQSEPALDMLTLCQVLQQDDPSVLSHFARSGFVRGNVSKSHMYRLKENDGKSKRQVEYLHGIINDRFLKTAGVNGFRSLDEVRDKLRVWPVMQVLHQVYMQLVPWNYMIDGQVYRLNVDELFERFIRSGTGNGTSIDQMTSYLENCIFSKKEAESRTIDSDEKKDSIRIKCLTVHKSKGLEYGYVILPFTNLSINKLKKTGMNVIVRSDNRIGYYFEIGDNVKMQNSIFNEKEEVDEKLKEETRVLYVAMTRSRKGFSWVESEDNNKNSWQKLLEKEEND